LTVCGGQRPDRHGIERFGERGVIDLVGLIGYFGLMSMV
jgi:hypothetical protein